MNIKRLCRSNIWLLSFSFFSSNLIAADFNVDGIAYNIISIQDKTCVVASHEVAYYDAKGAAAEVRTRLYKGHIEVPQNPEYKGRKLTVVGVDNRAFANCEELLSVTLPPTVKTIGTEAFYNCKKLINLYGDFSADIGYSAFGGCCSLQEISFIKDGTFAEMVFADCVSLKSITFQDKETKIMSSAFAGCRQLSKVTIEEGQSRIFVNDKAFKDSVIDSLYIGRNLKNMNYSGTFGIIKHLVFGDSVTEVEMNEGDKYNHERHVYDVEGLETVVFGKLISKVPAFQEAKLESITCRACDPPKVEGKFSNYVLLNTILYVPKGAKEAYENVSPWRNFIIKECKE